MPADHAQPPLPAQLRSVQALFDLLGAAMSGKNSAAVAAAYALPTVIDLPGQRIVATTTDQIIAQCDAYRAFLKARGIIRVLPRLGAVEAPRARRFRVWVTWRLIPASGAESLGRAVYYCRNEGLTPLIEMADYSQPSDLARAFVDRPRAA
jgi:hypothetical protein